MGDLSFLRQEAPHRRPPMPERDVQAALVAELDRLEIPYREQYPTNTGRIDLVVWNEGEERPYVGIEVKRDLGPHTSLSEWGDYVEQAAGYARELDVPVFIGPYIDTSIESALRPSHLHKGGSFAASVAATVILGKVVNVGVVALLGPSRRVTWALRGKIVLREEAGDLIVDEHHIRRMVRSTNSHKVRA